MPETERESGSEWREGEGERRQRERNWGSDRKNRGRDSPERVRQRRGMMPVKDTAS